MVKVYVGETGVQFRLYTETDLSGCITLRIKYIKPNGSTGYWAAVIDGDASDGYIAHVITMTTELDIAGRWVFWAYVVHSDYSVSYGEAEGYTIHREGR